MFVLRSSPSSESACHVASSLRLFVLNGLQVYCHVCCKTHLPSLWLLSNCSYCSLPRLLILCSASPPFPVATLQLLPLLPSEAAHPVISLTSLPCGYSPTAPAAAFRGCSSCDQTHLSFLWLLFSCSLLRLLILNGSLQQSASRSSHHLCDFWRLCFGCLPLISEGADLPTLSCHSVPITVWKSALFTSQPLSCEFVHELHTVSSHFPDIAFVLHLSTLCHCCPQCIFSIIHPLGAPHLMFFLAGSWQPCRNVVAG
jgi:hypothetical protein